MTDSRTPLHLTINGEPHEVAAGTTIADLIVQLGHRTSAVAVEQNRQVVRRTEHASTPLANGDQLEIVTFLGGG